MICGLLDARNTTRAMLQEQQHRAIMHGRIYVWLHVWLQ